MKSAKYKIQNTKYFKRIILSILVIALVTAGIIFLPKSTSEASWYDDAWHFRKKLTIDAGQVRFI